ncbi:MAG: GAP family protein [Patescibacteria group bacterium]
MMGIDLPTLGIVLATAAVDSINPCAIGVLVLMVSVVLGNQGSIKRLLLLGGLYIFAVFATYLVAGLGLVYFLGSIPLWVTEYLSIAVGSLVIFAGILEIKDFFWYGRGFSLHIPAVFAAKIKQMSGNITVPSVILLGMFVSAVELPCTGAPYLAIISILSTNFNTSAFLMLVLYNIVFVAPLIIILLLVAAGVKVSAVKQWKQDNKHYMRLAAGALLLTLGWLLILIANGTINFG